MQWKWILHTQGPDEPLFVIEAEGMARFIARVDEEYKTRAELMEHGFMLAAAPDLFVQAVRFSECLASMLQGRFAPTREALENLAADARAAIALAKGTPCDHKKWSRLVTKPLHGSVPSAAMFTEWKTNNDPVFDDPTYQPSRFP